MKQIILTLIIMSSFSELDGSILRDTSNPPLIDKGSELTYGEFDGNFVKQYNAIQSIVDGSNVEAYDPAATYDQYSTDVYEQYCGYDSRIWKATYNGSPSSFTGQTPAEGIYWTQVSLAQLLPNIMSLAELAHDTNARRSICPQYCTSWQAISSLTLNSVPVALIGAPAPGAGKIIIPKFVLFALDTGTIPYDYPNDIRFIYNDPSSQPVAITGAATINSVTDVYVICTAYQIEHANYLINCGLAVTAASGDATQGNGIYYVKVIYQIEDAPF